MGQSAFEDCLSRSGRQIAKFLGERRKEMDQRAAKVMMGIRGGDFETYPGQN